MPLKEPDKQQLGIYINIGDSTIISPMHWLLL